ncbi:MULTISPECIES: hypothetical protein [unclassified Microcoleus]|uniref:hypothetical protein n=1 Tax=unclassified Microcoleus TaxID=2642155 RepID=UPI002FD5D3B3
MAIYRWVGAGFSGVRADANMVGEPAPTKIAIECDFGYHPLVFCKRYMAIYRWAGAGFSGVRSEANMVGEPAPTEISIERDFGYHRLVFCKRYMAIYRWAGAGFSGDRSEANMVGEPAPTKSRSNTILAIILWYFARGTWRFTVGWGRVYEIVDYCRIWLANPPLQNRDRTRFWLSSSGILQEVHGDLPLGGGGFLRLSIIVGYGWRTRPYGHCERSHSS